MEFAEAIRFTLDRLSGCISGGHEHGVELTVGADSKPATRRMCMNLEHYFARGKCGLFVPRKRAEVRSERPDKSKLRVTILPFESWRITSVVTFQVHQERIIEAQYEFEFEESYEQFEALVSNYFHELTEPFVHMVGAWRQPTLSAHEHRTWVRDAACAAAHRDPDRQAELHRYNRGAYPDFAYTVAAELYDYPILVSPIRDTGWSVVHVIEPRVCSSVSANRIWHAHDFTLVCRDVRKGEKVIARAWMAYLKLDYLDGALELHDRFCPKSPGAA